MREWVSFMRAGSWFFVLICERLPHRLHFLVDLELRSRGFENGSQHALLGIDICALLVVP